MLRGRVHLFESFEGSQLSISHFSLLIFYEQTSRLSQWEIGSFQAHTNDFFDPFSLPSSRCRHLNRVALRNKHDLIDTLRKRVPVLSP